MNRRAQIAPSLASRALRAFLATALVFSSWSLFVKDETPAAPKTSIYDAIEKARETLNDDQSKGGAPKPLRLLQQARLDAAKAIIDSFKQDQPSPLAKATAISKQAFKAQAASLGINLPAKAPETPRHQSPVQAVKALMATQDVKLSEDDQDKLKQLDDLPRHLKEPLTDVIDSFVGFQAASRQAISTLAGQLATAENQDQNQTGEITDPELKLQLGNLLASRSAMLDASQQLGDALSVNQTQAADPDLIQLPAPDDPNDPDKTLGVISIDLSTTRSSTYTRDFILAIDAGGSDTYHNNAGGRHKPSGLDDSCLNTGAIVEDPTLASSVITTDALLDFGQGSDSYGNENKDARRTCGANGGGNFGSGFLFDGGGSDHYWAAGLTTSNLLIPELGALDGGTNGGGFFGAGFVLDAGGQDKYVSGGSGTNGGGHRGIGLLVDAGLEDDGYSASYRVLQGEDYVVVPGRWGVNGGAAGPLFASGLLVDAGGADNYSAGTGGVNGGGLSSGRGMLVDAQGDDKYTSMGDPPELLCPAPPAKCRPRSEPGANGGAGASGTAISSAGMLLDMAGSDIYTGQDSGVNGGASFFSVGLLLDGQGDDDYDAKNSAVNGGAIHDSNAGLIDIAGNDCYKATGSSGTNGGAGSLLGGFNPSVGGSALLLDSGGYDTYWVPSTDSSAQLDNHTITAKGSFGQQVDSNSAAPPPRPSPAPCEHAGPTTTTSSTTTSSSTTSSTTSTSTTSTTSTSTTTTSSTTTTTTPDGEYATDQPWVKHTPQVPVPTTYPSARTGHAMAFHEPSGKVVLFGGWVDEVKPHGTSLYSRRVLDETWTWDGSKWTKENPTNSPPARYGAAMAYLSDAEKVSGSEQVVMYGGFKADGKALDGKESGDTDGTALGDTWVWNGSDWEEKSPPIPSPPASPSARGNAGMAEDKAAGNLVLFGGADRDDKDEIHMGDTWTWNGENWNKVEVSPDLSPTARKGASMATDVTGRPLLFGGASRSLGDGTTSIYGDTWTWQGSTWQRRYIGQTWINPLDLRPSRLEEAPGEPIQPSPRSSAGLALHQSAAQVVMFGGGAIEEGLNTDFNDPDATWTWDGANWELRDPPEGSLWRAGQPIIPREKPEAGLTPLAPFRNGPKESVVLLGRQEVQGTATWTWDARKSTSGGGGGTYLSVDPASIPADGGLSTSRATVTHIENNRGVSGRRAQFAAPEADVWFETTECTTDSHGRCSVVIHSSSTPGVARIQTAIQPVAVSGRSASGDPQAIAYLTETAADEGCNYDPSVEQGPEGWWGTTDQKFGCKGTVAHRVAPPRSASQLSVYQGSKLLVAANGEGPGFLVRYLPDGRVDTSFGSSGIVKIEGDGLVSITDLKVHTDGKIFLVYSQSNGSRWTPWLARFNPDGTPDPGFGSSGEIPLEVPSNVQRTVAALAVQPDGKPVVVFQPNFTLERYNDNGTLDQSFGDNGRVVTRVRPPGWPESDPPQGQVGTLAPQFAVVPTDVIVQPDGKIAVSGVWTNWWLMFPPYENNPILVRYLPSGELDPDFNPCPAAAGPQPCGGKVMTDFEEPVSLGNMQMQSDGKIVLTGGTLNPNNSVLARYSTSGSIDPSFNPCAAGTGPPATHGPRSLSCGGARLDRGMSHGALAVQSDDKILTGGYTAGRPRGTVARYKANGTPDDNCGTLWVAPLYRMNHAYALSVLPDGKILAAGGGPNGEIGITRLMGGGETPVPPTSITIQGGTVKEPAAGKAEAPFALRMELDAPACEQMVFDYATSDGSAKAGSDYVETLGRVMFEKGDREKIIEVPVLADQIPEPPENFYLRASNPARVEPAETPQLSGLDVLFEVARGEAQIEDEPAAAPPTDPSLRLPGLSVGDTSVIEGQPAASKASFTVALDQASKQKVTVDYRTEEDSAKSPGDFSDASGRLTFKPGETKKTVSVDIANDAVHEPTEAFHVVLQDPQGARLLRPRATGTIYDDDPAAGPQGQNENQGASRVSRIPTAAGLLVPGANLPPPALAQGTQIQSQQQIQQQIQQQAQAQLMAGVMSERQRQAEIEKARLQGKDAYLATARRQTSPVAAWAFAWLGALAAFGTAMAFRRQSSAELAINRRQAKRRAG